MSGAVSWFVHQRSIAKRIVPVFTNVSILPYDTKAETLGAMVLASLPLVPLTEASGFFLAVLLTAALPSGTVSPLC